MANRIIDDETALTIFEALQETSTRNFSGYDRMRELPRHKINGELMFYLDELIDFAERELKTDPSEALGQVVDQGITAWFASLDTASQRKLGFRLKSEVPPPKAEPANGDESAESLLAENRRLTEALEAAAAEKVKLKREIAHLEQVNEEIADQQPASLSQPQGGPQPQGQPNAASGYMMDGQSGYMALTAHSLSGNAAPAGEQKKSAAQKKNKRRRKKKSGTAGASQGRPK